MKAREQSIERKCNLVNQCNKPINKNKIYPVYGIYHNQSDTYLCCIDKKQLKNIKEYGKSSKIINRPGR